MRALYISRAVSFTAQKNSVMKDATAENSSNAYFPTSRARLNTNFFHLHSFVLASISPLNELGARRDGGFFATFIIRSTMHPSTHLGLFSEPNLPYIGVIGSCISSNAGNLSLYYSAFFRLFVQSIRTRSNCNKP